MIVVPLVTWTFVAIMPPICTVAPVRKLLPEIVTGVAPSVGPEDGLRETTEGPVALMATIFLTVYGKEGIGELARHNLAKAAYAAETLSSQPGTKLLFTGAPRFHEFVLQTEESPALWTRRLYDNKIVGGIELSRWYPEL